MRFPTRTATVVTAIAVSVMSWLSVDKEDNHSHKPALTQAGMVGTVTMPKIEALGPPTPLPAAPQASVQAPTPSPSPSPSHSTVETSPSPTAVKVKTSPTVVKKVVNTQRKRRTVNLPTIAVPDGVMDASDPRWDLLAGCESSQRWDDTRGGYEGGVHFKNKTWLAFKLPKYPAHAYNATREQQIDTARRVVAGQGWANAFPDCSLKLHLR